MLTRAGIAALLAAFVLVSGVGGPAAAASGGATGWFAPDSGDLAPADVLLTASLAGDGGGDATWQVRYLYRLETANDSEAFAELREEVETDPSTHLSSFASRMNETVDYAAAETGREMSADGFSVRAERDPFVDDRGYVTYTFRWRGFAATDGNRLVVGDAVDGLYVAGDASFVVDYPAGYEVASASPAPTERKQSGVVWDGERSFAPGEPRLVLVPATPTAGTTAAATTAAAMTGAPDDGDGPDTTALVVGGALLAGATVALYGAVWLRRTWDGGASRREVDDLDRPTGGTVGEDAGEVGDSASEGGAGGAAPDTGDDGSESSEADRPPADLLSNEERVLRLLRDSGGRLRQQEIVEAFDWSEVKTSRVVRGMREEGIVEVFRLGRENVITLPDTDPI